MIRRHCSLAHAAYFDLLASLKDQTVAELRGTPTRVEREDKVYWYDTFRVGSDVRKSYIGEFSGHPHFCEKRYCHDLNLNSDIMSF
jgi:hypothetical protein